MQVHHGIEQLPTFNNTVLTIGTFDGVHAGHKQIIKTLIKEAKKINGVSLIITFDPHPRKIVNPDGPLQLINTLSEKVELLQETEIDHLVIVPFTKEFSDIPADKYVENFLVKNFNPKIIIIGYDHHFGKDRQGNFDLLKDKSHQHQYTLLEIPKHTLDEVAISSTKIRKAILESNIETTNKLLGYTFFFEGVVVEGDKLGRTLGYPTANLEYIDQDKIHLGHGVYAVYILLQGQKFKGMLSIGNRPTLNDPAEKIEVNIFDFNEDIYGEKVKVFVSQYLREQKKYDSLEELKKQIEIDKENSLKLL